MPRGICPFALDITGQLFPTSTYTPGGPAKVGFCDHTAAGWYTTLAQSSFWNSHQYSVHFGIGRRGEIVQVVNIFDTAFAQGRLGPSVSWPPFNAMGRQNPNLYLISIEHEDYDRATGKMVPGSQWTEEQYQADLRVKRWCLEELSRNGMNGLRFGLDSLAGHHMFDSVNRPECPGRFWRDEYRQRLFNDLTGMGGGEDEVYNPKDVWADFFYRNGGLKFNGEQRVNAFADFGWPPNTKYGLIEFYINSGPFEVFHGNGGYASYIGWRKTGAYQQQVTVQPDADGWITLQSKQEVHFYGARGLAYWT